MKDKYSDLREPTDADNLKGMILRDYGKIDEALEIFETGSESVAKLGNIARCYQKQKKYVQALDKLKECLIEMKKERNLKEVNDYVNQGYAYFWIAEIYYSQDKVEEANIFMTLCQEIWKEYSPGLLSQTEELLTALENRNIEMKPNQKDEVLDNFLKS